MNLNKLLVLSQFLLMCACSNTSIKSEDSHTNAKKTGQPTQVQMPGQGQEPQVVGSVNPAARTVEDVFEDVKRNFSLDGAADSRSKEAEAKLKDSFDKDLSSLAKLDSLECKATFCSITLVFKEQTQGVKWMKAVFDGLYGETFVNIIFPSTEELKTGEFKVVSFLTMKPGVEITKRSQTN